MSKYLGPNQGDIVTMEINGVQGEWLILGRLAQMNLEGEIIQLTDEEVRKNYVSHEPRQLEIKTKSYPSNVEVNISVKLPERWQDCYSEHGYQFEQWWGGSVASTRDDYCCYESVEEWAEEIANGNTGLFVSGLTLDEQAKVALELEAVLPYEKPWYLVDQIDHLSYEELAAVYVYGVIGINHNHPMFEPHMEVTRFAIEKGLGSDISLQISDAIFKRPDELERYITQADLLAKATPELPQKAREPKQGKEKNNVDHNLYR